MRIKPEYKTLWKQIDKILWEDWDPIGINDCNNASDEYTGYSPQILQMKLQGASKKEIAQKLLEYEKSQMGFLGNADNCDKVAKKIINL